MLSGIAPTSHRTGVFLTSDYPLTKVLAMNYQRHYDLLIKSRRENPSLSDYCERHHILPRSLGGSDNPENIIKLTAREHYFAHRLLAKIHGKGMWSALWIMSNGARPSKNRNHLVTPNQYEYAKEKHAEWFSKNHPFKGKRNIVTSAYRGWDAKRTKYDWTVINRIHKTLGMECYWRYRGHTWTQEIKRDKDLVRLGRCFAAQNKRGASNPNASKDRWVWQHKYKEEIIQGSISELSEKYSMNKGTAYNCTYGKSASAGDWLFLGPANPEKINPERLASIKDRMKKHENRSSTSSGWKATKEKKEKLSKIKKGKRLSESHKKKLSEKKIGRRLSEETRRKISEAGKGRAMPKGKCNFCGEIAAVHIVSRWHNNNCKLNPKSSRYQAP